MNVYPRKSNCCECNELITPKIYSFSVEKFELPLCLPCGEDLMIRSQKVSPLTFAFFKELKKRGVAARLEKWESSKAVDIVVVDAKLNIEIDGGSQSFNADQAMRDLLRILMAFKKRYLTLRIPNTLVKYNLQHTADLIAEFLTESHEQVENNSFSWK